ncbi:MAG: PAS domain S-box protein, partial [Candidatus Bathyarchaeia archaeon]
MAQSTVEYPERVVVDLLEKAPIRVLHVDDEHGFLKAAKQILEMQAGFQVDTASSVEEAEEKMKQNRYDVIVSDYIMPGKDGLKFLKELRDGGNSIPFIIFTGRGREIVAIRALNLGADLYVNKIGDPETVYSELAHGIRKLVEANRAEEALMESEEKLRGIFSSMTDGVTLVGLDGRVLHCNDAILRLHGLSRDEYVGRNVYDFIAPEDRQRAIREQRDVLEKGVFRSEVKALRKDGRTFDAEINVCLLRNASGEPIAFLGVTRDVTKRKKMEEKIRESEAKYRSLFENARDVVVLLDLKGNLTDINKTAVNYGFKRDEVVGKSMLKFVPKKYWPKLLKELVQIAQGKSVKGKVEINTPQGKKNAEYISNPIIMDNKVVGVQTILKDITERKQTEETLRRSEEKFRTIFESANDCMIFLDRSGRILDVNKKAVEVFGGSKEELLGKHFTKVGIFSLRQVPTLMKNFTKLLAGKQATLNISIKNKKGQEIPLECSASLMKVDDKVVGLMVIARDVTEREKMLEELKNSEERLSVLFEFAPDAYYLSDLKGRFVDGNRVSEEITGYKREELIGKSFLKLKLLPQRQIPKAAKLLAKNSFGKPTGPDECTLNRKDGTQVTVEIRTFPVKVKGQTLVLGIARDITERKRLEA